MSSTRAGIDSLSSHLRATVAGSWRTLRAVLTQRGAERDTALMLAKAAIATVLAWQLSVRLLDSATPFYAPMAALLVVDRTMIRSLWGSAQRLAAVVVGMGIAWLVGSAVGVHWWTMLPVMLLALLMARWRRLGDHGLQVPTMVLLSLLTVGGTNTNFTALTILETLAGGVVGVVVNAVVLPPLHLREPREQVASLGREARELLEDVADGLRTGWDVERARRWYDTSAELALRAPSVIDEIATGQESLKLNPRDNLRGITVDWQGYTVLVESLRRAQWHIGGIARTLVDAAADESVAPAAAFLEDYAQVVQQLAEVLGHYGMVDASEREAVLDGLKAARTSLADLGRRVREPSMDSPGAWPSYGVLILETQRVIRELSDSSASAVVPTESGPMVLPRPHARPSDPS